jgi:anti-sigma B factor antagonist
MALDVAAAPLGDVPGLAVRGEIDMATAPAVDEALADAIRASGGAFVVDLAGVEFLDSSGLQSLLRARALLGREDRALAVICPFGRVRRVFELSGVSDLFAFYTSREAALAALVPSARG